MTDVWTEDDRDAVEYVRITESAHGDDAKLRRLCVSVGEGKVTAYINADELPMFGAPVDTHVDIDGSSVTVHVGPAEPIEGFVAIGSFAGFAFAGRPRSLAHIELRDYECNAPLRLPVEAIYVRQDALPVRAPSSPSHPSTVNRERNVRILAALVCELLSKGRKSSPTTLVNSGRGLSDWNKARIQRRLETLASELGLLDADGNKAGKFALGKNFVSEALGDAREELETLLAER